MDDITRYIIADYIAQFGEFHRCAGRKYLISILTEYLSSPPSTSFSALIAKTASAHNITADTVRSAIRRFVRHSWNDQFFRDFWRTMTGYESEQQPATLEAVRLLCESYGPIVKRNRGVFERRATKQAAPGERSFFIHSILKKQQFYESHS